jgi:TonB family protein
MESPQDSLKLLLELEPRRTAFWSSVRAALRPVSWSADGEHGLWRDVFVHQRLPWRRFSQSAILHAGAVAMLWLVSIAWLRQQNVLTKPFDRSSVITYSPEEYLPPLDTGASQPAQQSKGDPAYSRQEIISVPPEADNRSQTIVAPPNVRLTKDVPMSNIVSMGAAIPAVPLDATHDRLRTLSTDATIVPPAPDLNSARSQTARPALTANVVAPPPEIAQTHSRSFGGVDTRIVEPPPSDLPKSFQGRVGEVNIGPSAVVAPAPELAMAPQHTISGRGAGGLGGGQAEVVAPPPSLSGTGGSGTGGRLIALGIHPAAIGPVAPPGGNRRGTFAATPNGRPGGSGTPGGTNGVAATSNGNAKNGAGNGFGKNGSLPTGLHVGDMGRSTNTSGGVGEHGGKSEAAGQLVADARAPRAGSSKRVASPVPDDKITETDRKVFGGKRPYSMTLNMPNLNSATGSWIIRFVELKESKPGELLSPVAIEKSDPGYPLELMRDNVQGTVTLFAIIYSDGSVRDIRVIDSPDDRLDAYASNALSHWKFIPASKNGTPVALETVVMIPFRIKRIF